ncbi:MAG TPA: hypothetical protein VIU62_01220, partial [Chloroflexota bacterium]
PSTAPPVKFAALKKIRIAFNGARLLRLAHDRPLTIFGAASLQTVTGIVKRRRAASSYSILTK